jgi:hypothetical protein
MEGGSWGPYGLGLGPLRAYCRWALSYAQRSAVGKEMTSQWQDSARHPKCLPQVCTLLSHAHGSWSPLKPRAGLL